MSWRDKAAQEYDERVTLEHAASLLYRGATLRRSCPDCHGMGHHEPQYSDDPNADPTVEACITCRGTGRLAVGHVVIKWRHFGWKNDVRRRLEPCTERLAPADFAAFEAEMEGVIASNTDPNEWIPAYEAALDVLERARLASDGPTTNHTTGGAK